MLDLVSELTEALHKLRQENALLAKRAKAYEAEVDRLTGYVRELKRTVFVRKSEKFISPAQGCLSFESSSETDPKHPKDSCGQKETDVISIEAYMPTQVVVIPVDNDKRQCHCGTCKQVIRYETQEIVHYTAPVYELIQEKREVMACP